MIHRKACNKLLFYSKRRGNFPLGAGLSAGLPLFRSKAVLKGPLHNGRERSKFDSRSGPVLGHSEHRRGKIRSRSSLCRGLLKAGSSEWRITEFAGLDVARNKKATALCKAMARIRNESAVVLILRSFLLTDCRLYRHVSFATAYSANRLG